MAGVCHNTLQCIMATRGRLLSVLYCNTHSVLWLGKGLGAEDCIVIQIGVL